MGTLTRYTWQNTPQMEIYMAIMLFLGSKPYKSPKIYTYFRDTHGIIGDIHGKLQIYTAFLKIYTAKRRYTWQKYASLEIYTAISSISTIS